MSDVSVAQQGGLGSTWVNTTSKEARLIAQEVFGVSGVATRFATEKDDTFLIRVGTGEGWVLKIANPDEPLEEISFQTSMLEHIAQLDPTLPIPRVRRGREGHTEHGLTLPDGSRRLARMLTFIEGTPLDAVTSTPIERFKVGQILARLRLALADFSHPAEDRVLAWDVQHLANLRELVPIIEDADRRARIESAFSRFDQIAGELAKTRFQVLHNDFSRSNIVVDKAHPSFVRGIIDFGDSVRTSVAVDVATALLNQLPSEPKEDLFEEGRDLLRGYLSLTDLTELELSLVPHLVMARVVARALLTTWRAKIMPENRKYILRNTGQGWGQLEWFLARDKDRISHCLSEVFANAIDGRV
jgi:Ser/Thr protein kinase RdoA (MazF antagonist)